MRFPAVKTIAIAAGLVLNLGSAQAAIISSTYAVTGSNFASTSASPYASITESFTITFDNTKLVSEQTSNIILNPSTITPAAALAYTYNPFADTLVVGGANTVATADPAKTDFALVINNASKGSNYGVTSLSSSVGSGTTFTATTVGKAAAVPEPASLALIASATGALAFLRRRRARG